MSISSGCNDSWVLYLVDVQYVILTSIASIYLLCYADTRSVFGSMYICVTDKVL